MEYTSDDSRQIFLENERMANLYVAKCLRVMAAVAAVSWLLNIVGIFIIPPTVMNIGMPLCIVTLLLPTAACRKYGADRPWMKYLVMASVIIGLSVLTVAIPKHTVLAWIAPTLLSCHFYSRKMTVWSTWVAVACMAVSICAALYLGEWDVNLMGVLKPDGPRVVLPEYWRRALLYFVLPRSLTLVALAFIGVTVSTHARDLLNKQAQDLTEQHRISSELNVAANIQHTMLTHDEQDSDWGGVAVYATVKPAKEVGGDFYDYYRIDEDHIALTVADVSGKGVGAAMFMSRSMTLLRAYMESGMSPAEVLAAANDELCINNREQMSAAAWLGTFELSTRKLTFANAGHEQPLLRHSGVYRFVGQAKGAALGGAAGSRYRDEELVLDAQDALLEYTGVTDTVNTTGEEFGGKRLLDAANRHPSLEPKELLGALMGEIEQFAEGAAQSDDIAMLALRC